MRPLIHCHLVNGPFGDPGLYAEFMFERRAVLFDLGDIGALSPRKLLRVEHVFVSHAHMDHFYGFDRLLRLLLGRDKILHIYGPAPFIDRVESKLQAYTWNVIRNYENNFSIEAFELTCSGKLQGARFQSSNAFEREPLPVTYMHNDVLCEQLGFRVRGAILDHQTACLGFTLEEDWHVNIQKDKLNDCGLAVGPWLRNFKAALLSGAPDATDIVAGERRGSELRNSVRSLGELRDAAIIVPGQRIAYIVDIRYNEENVARIAQLAAGVDLLFIESVFLDADKEHAARKNHLTARQAGSIARRIHAKRFVPFHFSARYAETPDAIPAEAERAFNGLDNPS